jgi:asparagine synthase (glutamine-hydrolysing)
MCGIVGIINHHESANPELVSKAADMLHKRGPDDSGIWTKDNIGLGHRRLSVLDLTEAGHQPMVSSDNRYVIVFNGEIYNHMEIRGELGDVSWKGRSDTETVLVAYSRWGVDCLEKFHGMFAFAIWDKTEQKLFAARDRMGVKPLYYSYDKNVMAFASRPRALFKLLPSLSDEFDIQGLRYYLQCGYFPSAYSIYNSVKKLPAAHYLTFSNGKLKVCRYWDYHTIVPERTWEDRNESELIDELDTVLSKSISLRMVSDVPLGGFLSGGIDSSLVVAMMARHTSLPVKTFTIAFDEKEYDESAQARLVAEHLGTEHHCERLRIDDLIELMPTFAEEYDEPFFDSSAFPVMAVSRLARQHVTVALSGDGGDELFGGYHYYQIADKLQHIFRLPSPIRHSIAGLLSMLPNHRMKLLAGAMRESNPDAAFAFSRSISKDFTGLLLPETNPNTMDVRALFSSTGEMFPDALKTAERGMRLDAMFTLPDDYLQKVDIASMAFSLEAREPLLDHDLVEWAMRLPLSWKLKRGTNKYLLRKLAYRYIPARILDRPKQGFGVPIDHWLRGPLLDWAKALLNDVKLFERIPVSQKRALELFEIHASGARNVSALLWALLMLLNFVSTKTSETG